MATKQDMTDINNVSPGDILLWHPKHGGYRMHPGPFTVVRVSPPVVLVKEVPNHSFNFNDFFVRALAEYYCHKCQMRRYSTDQDEKPTICKVCAHDLEYECLGYDKGKLGRWVDAA